MRRSLAVLIVAAAAVAGCHQVAVTANDATPANQVEANNSDLDAANQAICSDCPPYDNYDGPPLG